MNDTVGTVLGLTKDWSSLKRYGPPTKRYRGRRKEGEDGEEPGKPNCGSTKENEAAKGKAGSFEVTV